jgi:uncharacterized protein (DUF2249 family)
VAVGVLRVGKHPRAGEDGGEVDRGRKGGPVSEEPNNEPKKLKKAKRHRYTQMTLEYIRAQGKIPWIVERLIPSKPFMKRVDLFNLFDVVYFDPAADEAGYVQSTGHAGRSEHKKKMLETADEDPSILRLILRLGNAHADLYTWRKSERGRWEVTIERVVHDESRLQMDDEPLPLTFEICAVPTMAVSRARVRQGKVIKRP